MIHKGIMGYNQGGPVQPTQPSHSLGWDFSGEAPQLVEQGMPQVPTYGQQAPSQGFVSGGRYTPIQIGTTPTGRDYSAQHRPTTSDSDGGGNAGIPSGAEFASRQEFIDWNRAGISNGYYGTVDDAINAVNTNPNSDAARATLTDFYNNARGNPYAVQTPGTIGRIADILGVNDGEVGQNVHNVGVTLDQSYTQPGSFDYMDTVTPSNAALDSLNTYGGLSSDTISAGTNTSAPAVDYSDFAVTPAYTPTPTYTPTPVVQPEILSQAPVSTPTAPPAAVHVPAYNPPQDNNDSDYGGSQTGSQTSHSGGYGGFADDAAVSDQGGGDSGGGGGTYCCTASVKQKVMTNKELYALHNWHHSQSTWWIEGYDVWGKWVAKNLVSKNKYFAHLTKAFYDWKVNNKFTFKALQAAAIIYPGVVIASLLKESSDEYIKE